MTTRFDRATVKATRNNDGFIYDTPVLTRTGVFLYRNHDGTDRREYRPADEVFKVDSLAAYKGLPITNGHPGRVTNTNVTLHAVGTVLTSGRQDGDNLLADVVIHNTAPVDKGLTELSVGYDVDLEETPGVAPNGERYDAIQRNIRPNHLAIVSKGRAGNARLNMDGNQDDAVVDMEMVTMPKLRLDNGIEYDAAPEVVQAYGKLTQDIADALAAKAKADARADGAEADLKKLQDEQTKIKQDALEQAKERLSLEAIAKTHGVEVKQDAKDVDIKKAVVAAIRGDGLNLDGRSDDYIAASFDLAILASEQATKQQAVANQRQDMTAGDGNASKSSADARAAYIKQQQEVK